MDNFKVHILSIKPEICQLIRKTLDPKQYNMSCTSGENINEEFIKAFNNEVNCLIIDKDIDDELKNRIKQKFSSISIICLPSLGTEFTETNGVKYMSEPFKLSELKKAVEEISEKIKKSEN